MTEHLEVSRKQYQPENIINITSFGKIAESPGFQMANTSTLFVFDNWMQCSLGRELMKETSSPSTILHFDSDKTLQYNNGQ